MVLQSIKDLLDSVADSPENNVIIVYPPSERTAEELSYKELQTIAKANSRLLLGLDDIQAGSIVLLHFNHHMDHIIWLWSVVCAGCIPAMSLALPTNPEDCERHIKHLSSLIDSPVCLTKSGQLPAWAKDILKVVEVDKMPLNSNGLTCKGCRGSVPPASSELALLMMTSGSTGHSKAVGLSHGQILASLFGKSVTMPVDRGTSFFNWIRLDHVGSLVEIHLHALYVDASQVQIQPEDIISDPTWFLESLHRHRVGITFAPNFFLADLQRLLQSLPDDSANIDLRCLRYIVSGGEAVDTKTCALLSNQLSRFGAPQNVIVPGFGMTETCAGCVYNTRCPNYDLELRNESASLGECIPGVKMRIALSHEQNQYGEAGELQLRGHAVFSGYYSDETSTAATFTQDGWFKTGDTAVIDSNGKLKLLGRGEELISVNGIKYPLRQIEAAIEDADIDGVRTGSVRCFSHRPPEGATDIVGVIYQPLYPMHDAHRRFETMDAITQRVLFRANCRPYILPLDPSVVDHTTLGKVSRAKLSRNLREGRYQEEVAANAKLLVAGESVVYVPPWSDLEKTILQEWARVIDMPAHAQGVDRNMFQAGLTSVQIIKLQQILARKLQFRSPIPTLTLLANPTVRRLAAALQHQPTPATYAPVVILQSHGQRTPLWLIHPAAGEALVFLELSRYFTQRPVYALRARGFHPNEERFGSLSECVGTYHAAIKKQQPAGPYAIAGYSYGGMVAFELAKVIESEGDEVRFLASLNRPPHVHPNLRTVQWTTCMTHLAFFLDLISEECFHFFRHELKDLPNDEAVDRLMKVASVDRLRELSLDAAQLKTWADVTLGLQDIARQYQPSGRVRQMDVFYCEPLAVVECDKSEWLRRLQQWQDFVDTDIRYHHAEGQHHDMIGSKYAYSLQRTLRQALADRGI